MGRAIADAVAGAGVGVAAFDVGEFRESGKLANWFVRLDVTGPVAINHAVGALPAPPSLLVNNTGIRRDRSS